MDIFATYLLLCTTFSFVGLSVNTLHVGGESFVFHSPSVGELDERRSHVIGLDARSLGASPDDDCHAAIHGLGRTIAEYSQCVTSHSLNSTVCQDCITQYAAACRAVGTNFTNLHDEFGRPCNERLIVTEGSWTVISARQFVSSWKELDCNSCYVVDENDNCLYFGLTNDTILFFEASKIFYQCAVSTTKGQFEFNEPFVWTSEPINTTACVDCHGAYQNLTKLYSKIGQSLNNTLCQDVSDVMNYTRWLWNEAFHCHLVQADILSLILISCFLALLPLTFYIASYLNGSDVANKLLPEKRLRSTTSIDNSSPAE